LLVVVVLLLLLLCLLHQQGSGDLTRQQIAHTKYAVAAAGSAAGWFGKWRNVGAAALQDLLLLFSERVQQLTVSKVPVTNHCCCWWLGVAVHCYCSAVLQPGQLQHS
jgi:hypothetical protein